MGSEIHTEAVTHFLNNIEQIAELERENFSTVKVETDYPKEFETDSQEIYSDFDVLLADGGVITDLSEIDEEKIWERNPINPKPLNDRGLVKKKNEEYEQTEKLSKLLEGKGENNTIYQISPNCDC